MPGRTWKNTGGRLLVLCIFPPLPAAMAEKHDDFRWTKRSSSATNYLLLAFSSLYMASPISSAWSEHWHRVIAVKYVMFCWCAFGTGTERLNNWPTDSAKAPMVRPTKGQQYTVNMFFNIKFSLHFEIQKTATKLGVLFVQQFGDWRMVGD